MSNSSVHIAHLTNVGAELNFFLTQLAMQSSEDVPILLWIVWLRWAWLLSITEVIFSHCAISGNEHQKPILTILMSSVCKTFIYVFCIQFL